VRIVYSHFIDEVFVFGEVPVERYAIFDALRA